MKIELKHCQKCGHKTLQVRSWTNSDEREAVSKALPVKADIVDDETSDCWLCTTCGGKTLKVMLVMPVPTADGAEDAE